MSQSDKTCPSARAAPGAMLLGIKGANGRIQHMRTPLVIDDNFVEIARSVGAPEARMRFASPCQTKGCAQWTGTRCGVIDNVLAHLAVQDERPQRTTLPACAIRATCRWFDQTGDAACLACDLVVTDQSAIAAE